MLRLALAMFAFTLVYGTAAADEVPIAGTVEAIDLAAGTITVAAIERGKRRLVVIEIRPGSKIVRTQRSTDPERPGFVEQALPLEAIRLGWTVSVRTRHDGDREVAEVVRILRERPAP